METIIKLDLYVTNNELFQPSSSCTMKNLQANKCIIILVMIKKGLPLLTMVCVKFFICSTNAHKLF